MGGSWGAKEYPANQLQLCSLILLFFQCTVVGLGGQPEVSAEQGEHRQRCLLGWAIFVNLAALLPASKLSAALDPSGYG